jgi:hypothetical protein
MPMIKKTITGETTVRSIMGTILFSFEGLWRLSRHFQSQIGQTYHGHQQPRDTDSQQRKSMGIDDGKMRQDSISSPTCQGYYEVSNHERISFAFAGLEPTFLSGLSLA